MLGALVASIAKAEGKTPAKPATKATTAKKKKAAAPPPEDDEDEEEAEDDEDGDEEAEDDEDGEEEADEEEGDEDEGEEETELSQDDVGDAFVGGDVGLNGEKALGSALGVAVLGSIALSYGIPLGAEAGATQVARIADVHPFAVLDYVMAGMMLAAALIYLVMPHKALRGDAAPPLALE